MIDEGWALLRMGIMERVPASYQDPVATILERSVFECCFSALERHLLPVGLPSPLVDYCARLATRGVGDASRTTECNTALRALLRAVRKRWPARCAHATAAKNASAAQQLDNLLAQEAAQELAEVDQSSAAACNPSQTTVVMLRRLCLLRQCASSLFSTTSYVVYARCAAAAPHSCVPNAQLQLLPWADAAAQNCVGGVACSSLPPSLPKVALAALRAKQSNCEQASVAWVNVTTASLNERTTALCRIFGAAFTCSCARCINDDRRSGIAPDSATPSTMLARDAMEDGRASEAVTLLRARLVVSQSDGDAWLLLGTALLSLGRWADAHDAWRRGATLAPDHHLLTKQRLKDECYDEIDDNDVPDACASGCSCVVLPLAGAGTHAQMLETTDPLFTVRECQAVIDAAEAHAGSCGGWTTTRHHAVPTTDVPIHAVPALRTWFNRALRTRLAPLLELHFSINAAAVRVHDAFLVKYAAGGQAHLPMHTDESQLSLTIILNSPGEAFNGGGTYFADLRRAVSPATGHVIAFHGDALHGGEPVRPTAPRM